MESAFDTEASVSQDGKSVIFDVSFRGRTVQCSIKREALEQYFWAPAGADDARLLKAYIDGRKRIEAAAERKMLRAVAKPIGLNAADFHW
jgi:hypothetical protein